MQNAITIDLEDWYQGLTSTGRNIDMWPEYEVRIEDNCEQLLDILSEGGVKGTFFVLGHVADRFPSLIKSIADGGHEIALHSYNHQKVSNMTPEEFSIDVARGRDAIRRACGLKAEGYRAPMFSINKQSLWALEILREMGFRYDSSFYPIHNFYYGIPDAPRSPHYPFEDDSFIEFPAATVRFLGINWPIAGGFYLRLLPYSLIRWGIQRINEENNPAIIYIHPWDLDANQPKLNPTVRERFTHYYNRESTKKKLSALLKDFEFGPINSLLVNSKV